jgi:hypothetical protein
MLVTPRGEPVPPQSVVRRLAAVDPRLSVKWVPMPTGAYWGIIERWKEGDPRFEMIQKGEMSPDSAFDLRAILPAGWSVEESESFVARHFERVSDPGRQAEDKVKRILKHNRAVKEQHIDNFLVEQEEKHVRTTKHDLELQMGMATAAPVSSGVGEGTIKKSRRKAS